MALKDHAKRELELMGEDQVTIDWYLKVIDAFTSYGHSGGSAQIAIPVIHELLQFRNLTDLTDDPEEWNHISAEESGGTKDVWQSKRRADAFSNDGGKTYYLLGEKDGNVKIHESAHKAKDI